MKFKDSSGIGPLVTDASWPAPSNESNEAPLRRLLLLRVLANHGGDDRLVKEAGRLAVAWLSDRKALAPDAVGAVPEVAARNTDERVFDQLLSEARNAKDAADRQTILNAVGFVVEVPLAERALAALVAQAFSPGEARRLRMGRAGNRPTRAFTYHRRTTKYSHAAWILRITPPSCSQESSRKPASSTASGRRPRPSNSRSVPGSAPAG